LILHEFWMRFFIAAGQELLALIFHGRQCCTRSRARLLTAAQIRAKRAKRKAQPATSVAEYGGRKTL
jgi:hypothetical protein